MKSITVPCAVLLSTLLVACGGDSTSSAVNVPQPKPPSHVENTSRLLVLNDDATRPELSLYDLNTQSVLKRTVLSYAPSALYSSPNDRYGILMNRMQDEVAFFDGIAAQPNLLNHKLYGAAPTHYREFNGQVAIFYDGHDTGAAKFDVFTEQDIAASTVSSQRLPYAHHGVAEPRGQMVLSTYLPAGETKVSLVKSYGQHGDHYHVEQSLKHECPGLHGAASNMSFTAFGCEDGILLVEQKGKVFEDIKLPMDVRIGTIVGHENAKDLVGLASTSNQLFVVNAETKRVTAIDWAKDADTKRLEQLYSASGKYFVVLDNRAQLSIWNTENWMLHQQVSLDISLDQIAASQLVVHGQVDEVFVSDLANQQVIHIDLKTGEIKQRYNLDIRPKLMTWLGN